VAFPVYKGTFERRDPAVDEVFLGAETHRIRVLLASILTVRMLTMLTRALELPRRLFFLFGPRATGKTTWLRQRVPGDAVWFDLLRMDTMLDVRLRSTQTKIQSCAFHIASREDLIRLKELAARDRQNPADLQDLEFLKRTGRASS
jgi:hypothetical protein